MARRDKLQRLRAETDHVNQNQIITILKTPIQPNAIVSLTTLSSIQSNELEEQQITHDNTSSICNLNNNNVNNEYDHRQKMVRSFRQLFY